MLLVAQVKECLHLPAITHLDHSARVQTVDKTTNPKFWQLIHEFKMLTGCALLVNTSFNVRGRPMVCDPEDAFRCFMQTEMDYLILGNYLFDRTEQRSLPAENIDAYLD
jgi:carbamoyltransferase